MYVTLDISPRHISVGVLCQIKKSPKSILSKQSPESPLPHSLQLAVPVAIPSLLDLLPFQRLVWQHTTLWETGWPGSNPRKRNTSKSRHLSGGHTIFEVGRTSVQK